MIKFIENFCHHSKGRSDLIKLELWQKAIISVIFGIQDAEKVRVFREIFIVIGRKNGKSLFASALIAYMAFLEPEYGQEIYCLAPKLDQAALVYDGFHKMVKAEPELLELARKRRSDIYIEETESFVKPIAFNAKKSDGFNPQLVVCDEMAAWRGDAGLKQYEVMKSALGARTQPMILSISTAGYENDSIYDELMKRSTSFLKGNSKERRLLPFIYMIDDVEKWNDIEELKKANPNMGVSVKEGFFIDEIAVAEGSLSKKAEFLCKYCNIKHTLGAEKYERYMDDFIILSPDKEELRRWLADIERFLREELILELNPKTAILCAKNGIDFVGYKHRTTHRKVRPDSIKRIKRTIKKYERGEITRENLQKSIASWTGHAGHADSLHLRKKIIKMAADAQERAQVAKPAGAGVST